MANADVREKININVNFKPPKKYKVIYINDDHTPMDFVILTLMSYFNYNEQSAMTMTYSIHEEGAGVVAVLPHEIAEQKGSEIMLLARQHGFPFVIRLEEE